MKEKQFTPELKEEFRKIIATATDSSLASRDNTFEYINRIYAFMGWNKPNIIISESILEYLIYCNKVFIQGKEITPELTEAIRSITTYVPDDNFKFNKDKKDLKVPSGINMENQMDVYNAMEEKVCTPLDKEMVENLPPDFVNEMNNMVSDTITLINNDIDQGTRGLINNYSNGHKLHRLKGDSEIINELNGIIDTINEGRDPNLFSKSHWNPLISYYGRMYMKWYKFATETFDYKHSLVDDLMSWEEVCDHTINRVFFQGDTVVVLENPTVHVNDGRIHNDEGPAIETSIEKIYYWKNIQVPGKLIETPEKINKEDLRADAENAEVRRAFIEKMGVKNYFNVLSGGEGLREIDSDTDDQGFPMTLYDFDFEGTTVQVLECVCPSTERVYNIYPPSQNCKNVWDAKADTFSGAKLTYRHGDVGLVHETIKDTLSET